MSQSADAIVIGAGISGIVAAVELLRAGRRVIVLEQASRPELGGQAGWSPGGLFLVDSPEQRRSRIRDDLALATLDWFGGADFDHQEDATGIAGAEAFLDFAAGELRDWLREREIRLHPHVQWSDRGGDTASAHGSSVPRLHRVQGGGAALLEPLLRELAAGEEAGLIELRFGHRVDALLVEAGAVVGARGTAPSDAGPRTDPHEPSTDDFELRAGAVVVASGGFGGNAQLVRESWPDWLGTPPQEFLLGAAPHTDGRMQDISADAGAQLLNRGRMQLGVHGVGSVDPRWEQHGIHLRPGPSSLWLDAEGHRLPAPYLPGYDPLAGLDYLRRLGHEHSWLILNQPIARRELHLDWSEAEASDRSLLRALTRRLSRQAPDAIEAFLRDSEDVVVAESLDELFSGMTQRSGAATLDTGALRREIEARDGALANRFTKDAQLAAVHAARRYRVDRLLAVAAPRPMTDPRHLPYIAIRMRIVTGASLGGIRTDPATRALRVDGTAVPGLYAVGEAAGFGGGGMHGYRALAGSLLAGSIFTGRAAGRAIAEQL